MTQAEKAKAYDEVIERAKKWYNAPNIDKMPTYGNRVIEEIFPELKESEDEKIRKILIDIFNVGAHIGGQTNGVPDKDILAWLEKQGGEMPADKVKPKFKIGDWVTNGLCAWRIDSIDEDMYYTNHCGIDCGGDIESIDKEYHLWTIQDAKDGDVLACNEEILLFKSYSVQGRISLYCWYNGQTNNFHSKEVVDTLMTTRNKICPATKEQRDTLMKAIADAGYTFDFEKKQLKLLITNGDDFFESENCEQKHVEWSEEDERICQCLIEDQEEALDKVEVISNLKKMYEERIDWPKSLKQRIGG